MYRYLLGHWMRDNQNRDHQRTFHQNLRDGLLKLLERAFHLGIWAPDVFLYTSLE